MTKIHRISSSTHRLLVALTLCALLFSSEELWSQARTPEYISRVTINNVTQTNNNEIEFDLFVCRTSNSWERWANGTFQLKLVGVRDDEYNSSKMTVNLVPGTSGLELQNYKNGVLTRYAVTPRIFPGRISITVAGPDEFADCEFVPRNDSMRIGRFHVAMLDSTRLRDTLTWATPIEYYQANAYKVEVDSVLNSMTLFNANDNVEMRDLPCDADSENVTVRRDTFTIAARPPRCMAIDSLTAFYIGNRLVHLGWRTTCEQAVQGYILRRRVKSGLCLDPSQLEFHEIRRFGNPFDPEMFSKGSSTLGFQYDLSVPDTTQFRDLVYEYELSGVFFDGERRYLDTAEVYVPNSVILKAAIFPNPVTDSATIRYMVEDGVRITAKVYDVTGKELQTLMDKKVHNRRVTTKSWLDARGEDTYSVGWSRPDQAAQGSYFVVFTAYPIDDTSIEMSRAVVKIMLLR